MFGQSYALEKATLAETLVKLSQLIRAQITHSPRHISYLPLPKPSGRPRFQSLREVLSAILYLTSTGCSWRSFPPDFPNYNTVFGYFNGWKQEGIWELIHQQLRESVKRAGGETNRTFQGDYRKSVGEN